MPITLSLLLKAQFPAADLEDLLIFLSRGLVQLFCCAYVLLQISNCVLPGLQAFCEKARGLCAHTSISMRIK